MTVYSVFPPGLWAELVKTTRVYSLFLWEFQAIPKNQFNFLVDELPELDFSTTIDSTHSRSRQNTYHFFLSSPL